MQKKSPTSTRRTRKGILRKAKNREIGIFVDGVNLDRVCKRLGKRISLSALVQKLSTGGECLTARYYTLIPNEDDSRQRAFLDVVRQSGLSPCVKRLPPPDFEKQISIDVEMSNDILAFGLGAEEILAHAELHYGLSTPLPSKKSQSEDPLPSEEDSHDESSLENSTENNAKRIIYVVCPNKEICYPFRLLRSENVTTVVADFSSGRRDDIIALASEFIDLSEESNLWLPEKGISRTGNS
jgi:hypothetical protein